MHVVAILNRNKHYAKFQLCNIYFTAMIMASGLYTSERQLCIYIDTVAFAVFIVAAVAVVAVVAAVVVILTVAFR